jgi:hypothetical protein
MPRPLVSVVVAFHDMAREAARTLHTLSAAYQRGVSSADYDVTAVDVGSDPPLDERLVRAAGPNIRLLRFPRAPSPAAAINAAVRQSAGEAVMICIDGARMLSPGVLRLTTAAFRGFADPLVATVSWHLGPKPQHESMLEGYDQRAEDRLLESVDWRSDGYALFQIAALAPSSRAGWLGPISESNCLALRRQAWERLGGYDERFASPGGGLVNPDFYRRACDLLGPPVMLLGEGTFHQFHGGAATNAPRDARPVQAFLQEYQAIRGVPFEPPGGAPILLGGLPAAGLPWLAAATRRRIDFGETDECGRSGKSFSMTSRSEPETVRSDAAGPSRVVAILGMHRSGTSLLAGTLQECGLDLGEVNTSAPANEKGNRESWLLTALHEDLLRAAGGGWDRLPERPVSWGPLHREIRDLFVGRFAGRPVWGFKDPRLLFCLEGWLEVLPRLELVGVFRHPLEVAGSLVRRTPARFTLEKALALWLAHNRRLLAWQERIPCPLLEFGDDGRAFNARAAALARRLGLPRAAEPAALTFFDAGLRHERAGDSPLPDDVAATYGRLRELAATWE